MPDLEDSSRPHLSTGCRWAGKDENVEVAQQKLVFRAYYNSLANQGKYTADTEIDNG